MSERKCGLPPLQDVEKMEEEVIYCDGKDHFVKRQGYLYFIEPCPVWVAEERKARLKLFPKTFENFDPSWQPEAFERAREAVELILDGGLGYWVFAGPTGTGKTHLAMAVANAVMLSGKTVEFLRYLEVAVLFHEAKKAGDLILLSDLIHTDLLIIDDIGSSKITDSFLEGFQYILDERDGEPLLLTTNLNRSDLEVALGPKITSRLTEYLIPVVFKPGDYRIHKNKEG